MDDKSMFFFGIAAGLAIAAILVTIFAAILISYKFSNKGYYKHCHNNHHSINCWNKIMKLVDSNEPRQIRESLINKGWGQERLSSGDYAFFSSTGQSIGIERKTISDLISSLQGRLPNQFLNLIEDYEVPILLIEGHWGRQGNFITQSGQIYNITWEQLWNFVRTWQDRNISLELTMNIDHTLDRLDQLYRYYQKSYHSGGIGHTTSGDNRVIALQCQGIGASTAQILLSKFGTLQKIANSDYVELAQAGIGMKKAMAIYKHFRQE